MQYHPYEVKPCYTFQIDSRPREFVDHYASDVGFDLYSARLIELMEAFGVKFEHFPAKLVDEKGRPLSEPRYYIFHSLEDVLDAMDKEKSEWPDNWRDGVPRLVLDYDRFEHRPLFVCKDVATRLMRNDLKETVKAQNITGFWFRRLEDYKSGKHVTWENGIP